MKFIVSLVAAAAGLAAAAQQAADVYLLPAPEAATPPSISRSLARMILLQRLAPTGRSLSFTEAPDGSDAEEVVALLNQFGKVPPQLFSQGDSSPKQLVLMFEGMTSAQIKQMREKNQLAPAFTINDPPSARAHEKLIAYDFYNIGATTNKKCSLPEATDPFETKCWSGKSGVAKYNVQKNPDVLGELAKEIKRLTSLSQSGEMETAIVFLPNDRESTGSPSWSDKAQELRRRQAGSVPDDDQTSAAPQAGAAFTAQKAPISACFSSEDSCVTATGNCSSHGVCLNRYAKSDGSDGKEACFACHCLSTASEKGSITHWAGPSCSKKDISVAFWLFAGFTVVMVTVLWLAISMLFNVGEEKLPGVIGAGVSKSK